MPPTAVLPVTLLSAAATLALPSSSSAAALTLNPFERALLGSRLASVRSSVRAEFESATIPSLFPPPTCDDDDSSARQRSLVPGGEGSDDVERDVVLIFPGAGGADALSSQLEDSFRSRDEEMKLDVPRDVATFDWVEHRGSVATAAFDGEAVGEACAEALLDNIEGGVKLRSVHSVGISVGAFAANAFARAVCSRRGGTAASSSGGESGESDGPYVRLTLLDPFTSRGLWGLGYGSRTFGLDVDFAEHVLNTDDPVPTTNEPLPLCHCVDVTGAPEREDFALPDGETMHCWPVAWYARYGRLDDATAEVAGRGKSRQKRVALPQHDEEKSRGIVVSK